MFREEFKDSFLYAKLPTRWTVEAAVAATTLALMGVLLLLLDVSGRTLVFVGAVAAVWFGSRIALVAVKARKAR